MKIKIGPISYNVIKKSGQVIKSQMAESGWIGMCNHLTQELLMIRELKLDLEWMVFCHELTHIIATVYGIDILDDNEQAVHALGIGFAAALKDNPWIVKKYLAKK